MDCVQKSYLSPDRKKQTGAKNHMGCAHIFQIGIRRINDVLWSVWSKYCVCVDARCCVVCRELDLVTLKRIFEVGTLSRLETVEYTNWRETMHVLCTFWKLS